MPAKAESGTTIFVLGLLGLLVCAPLGTVAWIMGNNYVRRARDMGVEPDGMAKAGRIMGMIATVLMILAIVVFVLLMVLGIVAGVSQQGQPGMPGAPGR